MLKIVYSVHFLLVLMRTRLKNTFYLRTKIFHSILDIQLRVDLFWFTTDLIDCFIQIGTMLGRIPSVYAEDLHKGEFNYIQDILQNIKLALWWKNSFLRSYI